MDVTKWQAKYDEGYSLRECVRILDVPFGVLRKHLRLRRRSEGLSLANKKRTHSQVTRSKISESRRKFLELHPHLVPYRLNHSSKRSNPEKIFETLLILNGIDGWVAEYQTGLYSYDFAFPDLKLDVEIDGATHDQPKVQEIDKRRDEWTRANGWTVHRIKAREVRTDIHKVLEEFLEVYRGLQALR